MTRVFVRVADERHELDSEIGTLFIKELVAAWGG
jgi:hypothetical protein